MVTIKQNQSPSKIKISWFHLVLAGFVLIVVYFIFIINNISSLSSTTSSNNNLSNGISSSSSVKVIMPSSCPYKTLADLTPEERHPVVGRRHLVQPPLDVVNKTSPTVTLVCCETSKGPWSIVVHNSWAPRGAERFLEMVNDKYFDVSPEGHMVPLMRCKHKWLCQFGLNGDRNKTKKYDKILLDDPNWLPEGPSNRENKDGTVRRFAKGYLAYAGAGPNSRSNQFIVSLHNDKFLAGGSPWEVPWGEVVGQHSFDSLDAIYTGYGENKNLSQGRIRNRGVTVEKLKDFGVPLLDYLLSCKVVDSV